MRANIKRSVYKLTFISFLISFFVSRPNAFHKLFLPTAAILSILKQVVVVAFVTAKSELYYRFDCCYCFYYYQSGFNDYFQKLKKMTTTLVAQDLRRNCITTSLWNYPHLYQHLHQIYVMMSNLYCFFISNLVVTGQKYIQAAILINFIHSIYYYYLNMHHDTYSSKFEDISIHLLSSNLLYNLIVVRLYCDLIMTQQKKHLKVASCLTNFLMKPWRFSKFSRVRS